MNNDNDLNLQSMTKLSGWLRYCPLMVLFASKIEKSRRVGKSRLVCVSIKTTKFWRCNLSKKGGLHPSMDFNHSHSSLNNFKLIVLLSRRRQVAVLASQGPKYCNKTRKVLGKLIKTIDI